MSDFDRLNALLRYEPETGLFFWRVKRSNFVNAGDAAGYCMRDKNKRTGYIHIGVDSKSLLAHRIAWLLTAGEWPDGSLDHIDQDGTNNSLCNLRIVSNTENCRNKRQCKRNTSGATGVYRHASGRWRARIRIGRRLVSLGCFTDIDAAIDARKSAEILYGFHSNHGKAVVK